MILSAQKQIGKGQIGRGWTKRKEKKKRRRRGEDEDEDMDESMDESMDEEGEGGTE